MKKYIAIVLLFVTIFSCQQSAKIGFVDNSELINEYQEKKDIETKLQGMIEVYQKRTDSVRQAFQLEINDAEIKARRMNDQEKQELSKELQDKDKILGQRLQFEQQQINLEGQAVNDSLIVKVKDFVKNYATSNGYDYILGSNEGGSVLFGNEKSDLTQTILDLMNQAYKNKE